MTAKREQRAGRQIEIIREFLGCLGRMDLDGAGHYLDDDCELILPFLDGMPPMTDKAAIVNQLKSSAPLLLERMDFTFDHYYPAMDPDVVIAEYHSYCPLLDGSGVYENDYIAVFRFRGDKIVLHREYLNPMKMHFASSRAK